MTRARTVALLVLLVLTGYDFGFQPQRMVESFKALRCCREHCQKSRPISAAERCCGVIEDQAGLRAVHTNAADAHLVAAAVVLPGGIDFSPPAVAEYLVVATAEPSRSPPIFLSNQTLLL